MPMYDRRCTGCGNETYDHWERISAPDCLCDKCGAKTARAILPGKTSGVSQDSIEGGIWIRHGLCWPDGTPRRFDSKSAVHAEAKRQGLVNAPRWQQGDKHLSRWV